MEDKMIKIEMDKIYMDMNRYYKIIDRIEKTGEFYSDINTRVHLCIPTFEHMFNYESVDEDGNENFLFEFQIPQNNNNNNYYKFADICMVSRGLKKPEIIIESKSSDINLDKCVNQLADYMYNSKDVKLGMLIKFNEFRFYTKNENNNKLILFWKIDIRKLTPLDKKIICYCRNNEEKLLSILKFFKLLYTQTVMSQQDSLVDFISKFNNKDYIFISENNIEITTRNVEEVLKNNIILY